MNSPAPLPKLRVLGRISVAFIVDIITVARMGQEFLDTLITVAIVQANLTPMAGDQDLQHAYGDYDAPPPDELRRPVSVNAIAASLKLPYETVRRRVAALAQGPGFELTPQGVVVSGEALNSPAHREMLGANYAMVRAFYQRLRELGALQDVADLAAGVSATASPQAVRAVARVSSDYILRMVDVTTTHIGDLIRGVIFLAVLRANTEHLPDDEEGTDAGGPASFVPDELRRPVNVAALSARLGIPHETVRRHCVRLCDDRMCLRSPEGLIVPAHVLARPTFVQLMGDNNSHVRRMFTHLARLGVVAEWERARLGEAVSA